MAFSVYQCLVQVVLLFWIRSFLYCTLVLSNMLCLLQLMQYYYQSGCLYRLRALGERHDMDITVGKRSLLLHVFQKDEMHY